MSTPSIEPPKDDAQRPAAPAEGRTLRLLVFRWIPWAATVALCVLVVVLTDHLRTLNEEYRALSATHTELRAQFMEERGKITELVEQIEQQTARLETQSRDFKDQTDRLRARNQEQQLDVDALQTANSRLADEKAELIRTVDELRAQFERQNLQIGSLESKLAEQTAPLQFLTDPAIRITQLADPKAQTKAKARVYWHDAKKKGYVLASGLEYVPRDGDKCLAFWVICSNEPAVPAGLFWTDASGAGQLEIKPSKEVACADGFLVTVEPAGGGSAPTGRMVLIGK